MMDIFRIVVAVIICYENVVVVGMQHGQVFGRYVLGKARAGGVLQREVVVDTVSEIGWKRIVREEDIVSILRLLCRFGKGREIVISKGLSGRRGVEQDTLKVDVLCIIGVRVGGFGYEVLKVRVRGIANGNELVGTAT